MAIKRIVSTEFWTDKKVVEQFTPEDKFFFLYLLTNPHTTQLGIYQLIPKVAAFETGYNSESISSLIERFEKHDVIVLSSITGEIAVKHYLKHSIVKGGAPVYDLLVKEAAAVKDKNLLRIVCLSNKDSENETVLKFVSDTMRDYFYENEDENEDDNDNDNDDSYTNRSNLASDSLKHRGFSYPDLKEMILQNKDKGRSCEWCGKKTTVIHRHHYPIPKKNGGTDIVEICSDCHAEFHSLESKIIAINNPGAEAVDSKKANSKNKGRTQFVPPTLEEVKAYIAEKKYNVNPNTFYDYFTAGEPKWVDKNGSPVLNWKQKIVTWASHDKEKNPPQKEVNNADRYAITEGFKTSF